MIDRMKQPIFVRPLTEEGYKQIEAALRSSNAFVLRCSQILLAISRGERVPNIAKSLSCDQQTVRNAIHAFGQTSIWSFTAKSPGKPIQETKQMTADISVGAASQIVKGWHDIEWHAVQNNVRRLQARIEKRDTGRQVGKGESPPTLADPFERAARPLPSNE